MSLNVPALEPNSWLLCANVSRLCAPTLNQALCYTAESGAPLYRGFRISSSTLRGPNASPYSQYFTTRAILRSGHVVRTVPANRRIDADRFRRVMRDVKAIHHVAR
jgi:hypothetical protein